jgi:perosamine synthetase
MNDPQENQKKSLEVPLAKPYFDDAEPEAAMDVVKSGWLIFGPKTDQFEREFAEKINVKHAIAVNSGSSALLVSLAALGIRTLDEIIVPDMTFVSTATACLYLGGIPVFTDINLDNYCIDITEIEKKISKKTKAIIPVHYAGHTADMNEIIEIAKIHGLYVLEDAAEAHLSKYEGKYAGTIGDMGIFSFTPSKPMTTGEGGMIVTNNDLLAEKCRLIKNFGDISKFQWDLLGFNFRMPEVMGAIGLAQLKKLDAAVKMRQNIAHRYDSAFKNEDTIILTRIRGPEDINYQLYTIRFDLKKINISRDDIIRLLSERGISSRLYYPTLHNQRVFLSFKQNSESEFRNCSIFARTALSLPIYPSLNAEKQNYVIDSLLNIIKMNKN